MKAITPQESRARAVSTLRRLADEVRRKGDLLRSRRLQADADFLEGEILEGRARRGWSKEDLAVEMILEGDGDSGLQA